jgi:hypothetical protein
MYTRFILSLGNVLFSLLLGAVALGFALFLFPDAMLHLFTWAGSLRETVIFDAWSPRYEGVLRVLADERQIVYMGFVLVSRALVGVVILLAARLVGGSHEPGFPI